jgi:hypothetical protein
VDELTNIDYERILLTHGKREGKMKEAITKLTASKDVIGAVRCGLHEKVIQILDKDVSVICILKRQAQCAVLKRWEQFECFFGAHRMREW